MTTRIAREIAGLKREMARLERLLQLNSDWVALRGIDAALTEGDADVLRSRRRHKRALARNDVYVAHEALSRALVLLEGVPEVADAEPEENHAIVLAAKDRGFRAGAPSLTGGSLLRRLRDTKAIVEFDGGSYAAYRGEVEFAEVEIVRTGLSPDDNEPAEK